MSTELPISIGLDDAVAAGVIGDDQALALRNLEASRRGIPLASEETIGGTSLQDAVLCVPVSLAAFTVGWLAKVAWWTLPFGLAGLWALAEILSRYSRRSLSRSLLLLLLLIEATAPLRRVVLPGLLAQEAIMAVFAIGSLLWWWRFRQPLALVVAGASGISLIITVAGEFSRAPDIKIAILGGAALLTTAFAVLWDITDIRRQTTRSRTAFWLHVMAAGTFIAALVARFSANETTFVSHPGLRALSATMAVLAVVLDRRIYFLVSLVALTVDLSPLATVANVVLLVFISVSAFYWNRVRAFALRGLPAIVRAQLPRTDLLEQGLRPTRRHREYRPRTFHGSDRFGGGSVLIDRPHD